jgi:nucleotide-binding universal stress UspA family protein
MTTTVRPVVAGVDGSAHSLAAARYAAAIAARRGLELHLVHGYLHPFGYGVAPLQPYPPALPDPLPEADQMLKRTAATLHETHPDLVIRTRQVPGGAAATLVDESHRAEIVVVGSRGLGGFAGLLLGSVGAQVAAHAHAPVIVVRPREPDDNPEDVPTETDLPVVVGVDGSEGSDLALEFAFAEAALRSVPLVAIHVYWTQAIDSLQHLGDDIEPATRQAAERLLDEALASWIERYPQVTVERRLVHSLNSEYELVEASRDAGLAVVGSRGRNGFSGLLLGSLSQALVHHAHCPVAVVHPRSHRD